MKINFIRNSYIRFYKSHKKEIDRVIGNCLAKGSLIAESEVEKFEKNFARFCNRKYCIAVRSGTDALVLASKIKTPVFLNDYRYRLPIEPALGGDFGLITYMNSVQPPFEFLRELRKKYFLIEDACQAAGRTLMGNISCFSFYPAKILGGIGKGGALVTDHREVYDNIRAIVDDKWNNLWLDEVKAAFLNVKLKYLPDLIKRRQKIADYYNKHLPQEIIFNKDCLQNYLVIVGEHDKFIKFMRDNGIEVFSDKSDFYEGNLEHAIRLPIYAELTDVEVKHIVKTVNKFYE